MIYVYIYVCMYTQITTINKSIQLILDDNVNQLQAFGFGMLPFVPRHTHTHTYMFYGRSGRR